MKNFEDLHVWQKAHHLTLLLYITTRTFPEDEKYGLVSQFFAGRNHLTCRGACDEKSLPFRLVNFKVSHYIRNVISISWQAGEIFF